MSFNALLTLVFLSCMVPCDARHVTTFLPCHPPHACHDIHVCHVIHHTHATSSHTLYGVFQLKIIELNGTLRRGERYLRGPTG